jgi:hypothetical protein
MLKTRRNPVFLLRNSTNANVSQPFHWPKVYHTPHYSTSIAEHHTKRQSSPGLEKKGQAYGLCPLTSLKQTTSVLAPSSFRATFSELEQPPLTGLQLRTLSEFKAQRCVTKD